MSGRAELSRDINDRTLEFGPESSCWTFRFLTSAERDRQRPSMSVERLPGHAEGTPDINSGIVVSCCSILEPKPLTGAVISRNLNLTVRDSKVRTSEMLEEVKASTGSCVLTQVGRCAVYTGWSLWTH